MQSQRGKKKGQSGGLTTADLIVLSLLAERPMHGYDLLREYERQEVVDWASVSKAQVYYAIQKLAGLSLIAAVTPPSDIDPRDKRIYEPTPIGLSALTEALSARDWAGTRIAQPFATWLGLSIHLEDQQIERHLQARLAFLTAELERERVSLGFIKTLTTARARAGEAIVGLVIAQLEAEETWLKAYLKARAQSGSP
jgi:DNA-binding PadR family transcriptional regulator